MCGIAGVRRFGEEPITVEEIRSLLLGIEHRGNHATGIALVNSDHTIHVHKNDTPAWKFVTEQETMDFLANFLNEGTRTAILHTRWATQGNPKVNDNNHPMFSGKVAAVHNGGINNDTFLFNNEKLTKGCDTDSDIIRAILDRDGLTEKGIQTLNRMSGSAAIAAITPEDPDALLLARSGSPIKYAVSDEKMWWCSVLEPLTHAVRPWVQKHGLFARTPRYDVSYMTMPDDTAYIFDRTGLAKRVKFKSCQVYRQPSYQGLNTSYASKRRNWQDDVNRNNQKQRQLAATTTQTAPAQTDSKYGQCPECHRPFTIPADKPWAAYHCTNKRCSFSKESASFAELDKAQPLQ